MKDVLIIAHFSGDLTQKNNNRFNYLANILAENNFNVELVTSSFSHNLKRRRSTVDGPLSYILTFIAEPPYSNNISMKRFYSHYILSRNLKKYLKQRTKPDIIYCAVPSLDVGLVAVEYAKDSNVQLIIDVQDLWPEAFKMVFSVPGVSNFLLHPMKKRAEHIYTSANKIISVSETYKDRIEKVIAPSKMVLSIYLGTDLSFFDELAATRHITKPPSELWLVYVGTLGYSYDIISVIDALRILMDKGISNIKFYVIGDGPLRTKFEQYATAKSIDAVFTGRLDYGKMVGLLKASDIAVNPINSGSAGSIINKHADYAAAGLPVLNTQQCMEYRTLVDDYKMGLNCENNNPSDMANNLLLLYQDQALRQAMGRNSRRLAVERFDRRRTYQQIVNLVSQSIGDIESD